ncbi:hypothetical protein OAT44_01095 [Alphaproteobacteria bacterium]|nr:hypothetical protein [Alphaproteobacteria bacterium]
MNVKIIKNFFLFLFLILFSQKISLAEQQKNLILSQSNSYSNKKRTFITFEDFKHEFAYTNSLGDYFRSVKRVEKKYLNENLINKNLGLYNEVDEFKKQEILDLLKLLTVEAWNKTNFKTNQFYFTLSKLIKLSNELKYSAIIEIALVEEQRKLLYQSVARHINKDEAYFRHLINHARYEVFKSSINSIQN